MKTVLDVLQVSTKYLEEKGIVKSRRQVEELMAHVLKLKRIDLYVQFDRPLEESELKLLRECVKRKATGEPVEYIVGEVEFYKCLFEVNPAVLIPRQETEILVSLIAEKIPNGPLDVWDVCTGSGCIGISLKNQKSEWKVTLSDISPQALEVARRNAAKNGVEVLVLQGDLLEPFKGKKADVIICNPPYVTEGEFATLDRGVAGFEPTAALVGGLTGGEVYERLARELPAFLRPHGKVFFEIAAGRGEQIKALFSDPVWIKKEVRDDWSGHNRFLLLEIE